MDCLQHHLFMVGFVLVIMTILSLLSMKKKQHLILLKGASEMSQSNLLPEGEWLRNEIAKGWDGPTSKRSVTDIINEKIKAIKCR